MLEVSDFCHGRHDRFDVTTGFALGCFVVPAAVTAHSYRSASAGRTLAADHDG